MGCDIDSREQKLNERLAKLESLEAEIKKREKAVKQKEKEKKQMVLRLPSSLWNEIASWAEDDFRSNNGQIEFILNEAVKRRKGKL